MYLTVRRAVPTLGRALSSAKHLTRSWGRNCAGEGAKEGNAQQHNVRSRKAPTSAFTNCYAQNLADFDEQYK